MWPGQWRAERKKTKKTVFGLWPTDGHRLGLAEFPCETQLKKGVIISKKGVQEIKKLVSLAEEKEDVEVMVAPPAYFVPLWFRRIECEISGRGVSQL